MNEKTNSVTAAEAEETSVHRGIPDSRGKRITPWAWVPSTYFAEGIPYIVVQTVSLIMYKRMGISNTEAALHTSLLYLPWVLKPFWSPIVDIFKTKRWWILIMQLVLGVALGAVALAVPVPSFFRLTLYAFWLTAFASATHDIACDGFYMLGLTRHQQAWFVGIRATFYRLAILTGQGFVLILAGYLESHTGLAPVRIEALTNPASQASVEVVRFVDLSTDAKRSVDTMSPLQKLEFYSAKAKQAATLDEAATYAYLAQGVVNKIKENPQSLDIAKAQELLRSISEPMDQFLQKQILDMSQNIAASTGELKVVSSTGSYELPLKQIPASDSNLSIFTVKRWNILQGQMEEKARVAPPTKKEPGIFSKAWNGAVAKPLGNFLKKYWGQEKKTPAAVQGAVGYVYFYLSRPPETGKEVTVLFGMEKGDKNIQLKEGARFIFNEKNWNKPARVVLQIDSKLKTAVKTYFLATAGDIPKSWAFTFYMSAAMFLIFFIYHLIILPYPVADTSRYEEAHRSGTPFKFGDLATEFGTTFVTFFQKNRIAIAIVYLLIYRFAEAQLWKLGPAFLVDPKEVGGLAMTTGQVGIAYGIFGKLGLSFGGILGGVLVARHGLKKWVWPMAMAITIPHIMYVYLAFAKPDSFWNICTCVTLESFGYGFGFTAYMLYMIFIAEGKYKTAHFAIATAFMGLSMMIPGAFCGWIEEIIGYQNFFVYIMIASLPTWIIVLFIPLDPEFGKKKESAAGQ